ncbi:adenylyltransferase/cytidyltransferase family protein [Marinobacter sp. AL4B]|uniref:adenylyltransferase/cytidyltransferase family protein n=1 Tax=Marinobacter sp. AL4B TaxID=2871173 RepID=UPI001CAA688E|nr:adenylyltransferase/cytidyltransferase family protein [Marinobacter sp. AL4B]MBZ0333219.1 adenylyltransferase/cytidyltransferase family protein [Marinobacter sp. AL4B]
MEKTVITYGTFDMFHIGHLKLLKRLDAMGAKLIVGVSTDEFNDVKGKKTLIPYDQRAAIVEAIDCVDMVIPEHSWDQKLSDVEQYSVDVFAIGDDWSGKFDFLKDYCEVVYLERTKDISTSGLKKSLTRLLSVSSEDLTNAFNVLDILRKELR